MSTPYECPKCKSMDIKEKGYLGKKYKCKNCGHKWDPSDSEYYEDRYYEDDDDDGYLF